MERQKMLRKLALAALVGGLTIAAPSGDALAEAAGSQDFTVVKIGANPGTVIARGVITAAGVEENDRLQIPTAPQFHVIFHFPQGDLFMTNTVGTPEVDFNPAACLSRITLHPTTVVTGGTDAYAGATGSATSTAHLTVLGGRNEDGTCQGPASPPMFMTTFVQASGTLRLP